ncbi:MAG TPA: glycosyltransferase [Caldithrix abyssi]|uniref:Glycosyltransferase n=1 Tax=Caldithrix abyssi TaxID=187145 RepID=A0A7V4TZJ5_CALAY|nr:glycosyltransferase [Caldithrix abyssi]
MQISVIIPVYNRPQAVQRAVNSVLQQTEPPLEIIVVDDGSTEETPQVLAQYGSKIKMVRQSHRGVSAARNAGIKRAQADWLAFLDSDDEWLPEKLAAARRFHEQNPDLLIFQSEEIWIRNGRRVNPKKKHQKYGGWIFRQSLPLCIVSPSAVVIHKKLFEEVGYFDEELPVCEDYDLWLRIGRRYPIGLDSTPLIRKYGGHADQLSRKYWGMDLYRIAAMEKHLADPALSEAEQRWVLEEIIKKYTVLISGAEKRGKQVKEWKQKKVLYQNRLRNLL